MVRHSLFRESFASCSTCRYARSCTCHSVACASLIVAYSRPSVESARGSTSLPSFRRVDVHTSSLPVDLDRSSRASPSHPYILHCIASVAGPSLCVLSPHSCHPRHERWPRISRQPSLHSLLEPLIHNPIVDVERFFGQV